MEKEIKIEGKKLFLKPEMKSEFEKSLNELYVYLISFFQHYYEETENIDYSRAHKRAEEKVKEILNNSLFFSEERMILIRFPRKIRRKLFLKKNHKVFLKKGDPLQFFRKIANHLIFLRFTIKTKKLNKKDVKFLKKWMKAKLACSCLGKKIVYLKVVKENAYHLKVKANSIPVIFSTESSSIKAALKEVEKYI